MNRGSVLIPLFSAALASTSPAQTPVPAPTRTDTLTRALAGLPEVPIRLIAGGDTSRFERLEMRDGRFTLHGRTETRSLLPQDVLSIRLQERRMARAAFTGMAWGAVVGAAVGALVTIIDNPCDYCVGPDLGAVIFAIPGLVLGTIAGATVELALPRWRQVYPRP